MTRGDERWRSGYVARCACGYRIGCELWVEGERLGVVRLFDNEEASETYGERLERCPRCGIKVELWELLSKGS